MYCVRVCVRVRVRVHGAAVCVEIPKSAVSCASMLARVQVQCGVVLDVMRHQSPASHLSPVSATHCEIICDLCCSEVDAHRETSSGNVHTPIPTLTH